MFAEYGENEKIEMLSDNSDKTIEGFQFTKHLTPSEMDDYREEFAQTHIEISGLKAEIKSFNDIKKAEMQPYSLIINNLQKAIKERAIEVQETVYLFPDYDTNEMGYYNSDGDLVMSRRLKPEERQMNIHSLNRKIS